MIQLPYFKPKKRIKLPHGILQTLANDFHVSNAYVSMVLSRKRNGRLAEEIREEAMQRGGRLENLQ